MKLGSKRVGIPCNNSGSHCSGSHYRSASYNLGFADNPNNEKKSTKLITPRNTGELK